MKATKRTTKSVTAPVAAQEAAGEVLKVLPSEYTYLSEEQLKLISTLSGEFGGIYILSTAKQLRIIEREQAEHGHKIVEFTPHSPVSKDDANKLQPYFSVKLGEDGLKLKVVL